MPHITFIHGIANKPAADKLLTIWRDALAADDGIDLGANGITSSMVYWADVLYANPSSDEDVHESIGNEIVVSEEDEDLSWIDTASGEEQQFIESLRTRLRFDEPSPKDDNYEPPVQEESSEFERVPLPWFIKRRVMKRFLRDVHHYLFNIEHSPRPGDTYQVQTEIRNRFITALNRDAASIGIDDGPHIVVSHSMGTVIAYDCFKNVADCPSVDEFMTIGSPLGLDEVQDKLAPGWSRDDGFPKEKVMGRWVNVYDKLDPVAGFDPRIRNDYKKNGQTIIDDVNEQNWGKWRHDIKKYLNGNLLRQKLASMLD